LNWAKHATRGGEAGELLAGRLASLRHTFRTLQIALNLCQLTSFWTFDRSVVIRLLLWLWLRTENTSVFKREWWANNRVESESGCFCSPTSTSTALRNKLKLQHNSPPTPPPLSLGGGSETAAHSTDAVVDKQPLHWEINKVHLSRSKRWKSASKNNVLISLSFLYIFWTIYLYKRISNFQQLILTYINNFLVAHF